MTKVGKLAHRSIVRNDKPTWLLRLQMEIIHRYGDVEQEGTSTFWRGLEDFINRFLWDWAWNDGAPKIKSDIETRIVETAERTELEILRNGKPIQTYYIQQQ